MTTIVTVTPGPLAPVAVLVTVLGLVLGLALGLVLGLVLGLWLVHQPQGWMSCRLTIRRRR